MDQDTTLSDDCFRAESTSGASVNALPSNSAGSSQSSIHRITYATGSTRKVQKGRRLASLFLQSGTTDENDFRKWFANHPEESIRTEYEEFIYAEDWKSLVPKAIENVRQSNIDLTWLEKMNLCENHVTFPQSEYYDIETSWAWLEQILQHNGINKIKFLQDVVNVMDKKLQKLNTLWIKGQSNAGKSLVMNSLGRSCRFYVTLNEFDEKVGFPLNDAPDQSVLFINEPEVSARRVELLKNGMEGQNIAINVKSKSGIILRRVPWLIASNHDLWEYCPEEKTAILNRCIFYEMVNNSDLIHCKKQLHPMMWKKVFDSTFINVKQVLCAHRNWCEDLFKDIEFNKTLPPNKTYEHVVHLHEWFDCELCQLSKDLALEFECPQAVIKCINMMCSNQVTTENLFCEQCIYTCNQLVDTVE